jgi:Flp pilus assembly protein TadG
MIEFALTAPFLLMLLLFLIEFGHGLNSYLTVVASARDAARLGAQGGADATALLNMVDNETARLPDDLPAASINCGSGEGVCILGVDGAAAQPQVSGRDAVSVKVCYDHPLIIGFPFMSDSPIHMCSKTTMRLVE